MTRLRSLLISSMVGMVFFLAPQFALVDNGDGTVTDDDTGLMWLQDSESPKTWDEAMDWADTLVFAGYDDWRLPSAIDFDSGIPDLVWNSGNNEFGYLYRFSLSNPANHTDIVPLDDYPWSYYWTSTEDPGDSTKAARFFWSYDNLWLNQMHPKSDSMRYTAVRGEPMPERAPECNDTYDNDNNGKIDYPEDWGCRNLDDDSEYTRCFEVFGRRMCIVWIQIAVPFLFAAVLAASYIIYQRRKFFNG